MCPIIIKYIISTYNPLIGLCILPIHELSLMLKETIDRRLLTDFGITDFETWPDGCVISGSFILNCINNKALLKTSDLDIYTPYSECF